MKFRPTPFITSLVAITISHAAHAATGTWNVDANGLWSEATNWASSIIADDDTSTANFTNDITADRTVSLDSARTLNKLVFSDAATGTPGSWLINNNGNAANTLTLAGTTPTITVNALGTGKTAEISAAIAGTTRINKDGTGTLVLSGANTYTGGMIATGGVVIMNNASANVGGNNSAGASSFEVRSTAAFRQSAGKVTLTDSVVDANLGGGTSSFSIGAHSFFGATASYGAYELSGGILEINNPWRMDVRRGQITQTGGELNINYNSGTGAIDGGRRFVVGGYTERGVVYATGGTTTITTAPTLTGAALIIGGTINTSNANGSDLTIAGTADWTVSGGAGFVHMTREDGRTERETGNLNLNGTGRLTTNGIAQGDTNASAIGRLNFNGGTLRAGIDNATFLQGITSARIYSGGATIDTNGKNITIGQNLVAPTGNGLTSVAIATGGSGYIGAPIVTITGGGGTGATAVADFDAATGTVTGITITSPGSGYTSNPTVSIAHGFQTGGTAATLGTITTGALTGGGLTKIGNGTLTLSAANGYTGTTRIDNGTLTLGHATNTLTDTGAVNVNGGELALGTNTDTVGAVTLTSGSISGSGAGRLTGTGSNFDVRSGTISAKLGGSVGLDKTTGGTVTISSDNSSGGYNGATSVSAGKLLINGNISTSTTTVSGTGTLGGSGTVGAVIVQAGGTLAPGNSIDSLTAQGNVTFDANSTFEVEIDTASSYDTLGITSAGTLNIASGAKLELINFGSANLITLNSRLQLIDYTGGTWNGGFFTFGTEELSDSATFAWQDNTWRINYNDTLGAGDTSLSNGGSYVTLTVIPEPHAALLGGLGLLALLRRRR